MTKVFAHRGSKGTHPENTLSAFREAVVSGADGIELDVQYTKDKELVVIHDTAVDRTTNGKGQVNHLTLKEVKKLDAGSWFDDSFSDEKIPTFLEVLDLLEKEKFTGVLNIELKTDEVDYPGIEEDVAKSMRSKKWGFDHLYSSFNLTSLERIHVFDPEAEKAYIMGTSDKKAKRARNLGFVNALHPKITWVVDQGVKLKDYPLMIRPWTVNSEVDMQYCFREKIDAIHTDFPREALRFRKLMNPLS